MRIFQAPQYSSVPDLTLSDIDDDEMEILFSKALKMQSPTVLATQGNIGIFKLSDTSVLSITPRFSTANVTHMVNECKGHWVDVLPYVRAYSGVDNQEEWLRKIIQVAFISEMNRLIPMIGLLKEYRRRTYTTSYPRGHIEIDATMRLRARGIRDRITYSAEERTSDLDVNRFLKWTLQNSHVEDNEEIEQARIEVLDFFQDVADVIELSQIDQINCEYRVMKYPENWNDYRRLLDMSSILYSNQGLSLDDIIFEDGLLSPSVCIDFQKLFETYVRMSLTKRMGEWDIMDGNTKDGKYPLYTDICNNKLNIPYLQSPKSMTADCDILVSRKSDGKVVLPIEVKCTELTQGKYSSRSEVEQAVVYAERFGTKCVVLVHPMYDKNTLPWSTCGKIGDILVIQCNVNLDASNLESEMDTRSSTLNELLHGVVENGL